MIKKGIALFTILIFIISLIGCSVAQESPQSASIRGTIINIDRGFDSKTMTIWLEGNPNDDFIYDKANVRISEETNITYEGETITLDDLFIGMTLEAWFIGPVAESYPVQARANKLEVLNIQQEATLNFIPVEISPLRVGKPEEDWQLEGLITFSEELQQETVEVYLYNNGSEDPTWGEIVAYLFDGTTMYEIGVVSAYGMRSLTIELEDVTGKGSKEIILTGGMGATYVETNIIGKDDDGNWVIWLSGGSYEHIDLDGNGEKEWVATSRGSIPPFVVIYRWNGQTFEWADVNHALASNYANLIEGDGGWIIESGVWRYNPDNDEFITSKRDYIYQDGKLINIP